MTEVAPRDINALFGARSMRRTLFSALWSVLAAAGCGGDTVVATGHVMIEGKPATGGRLSLTPVGGGSRAFAAVAEDGAFVLRSTEDPAGIPPGSYRVFFRQPLDAQMRQVIARDLAGEIAPDELMVGYRGPRDEPLVVPEGGDEKLLIDIRRQQGWVRRVLE